MKTYEILSENNNEIVENIILAPQDFVDQHYPGRYRQVVSEPDNSSVKLAEVSKRQACQALYQAGLLDTIETAISTMPRPAQIDWETASSIRRDWPLVTEVAAGLNWSEEDLDNLFRLASTL